MNMLEGSGLIRSKIVHIIALLLLISLLIKGHLAANSNSMSDTAIDDCIDKLQTMLFAIIVYYFSKDHIIKENEKIKEKEKEEDEQFSCSS